MTRRIFPMSDWAPTSQDTPYPGNGNIEDATTSAQRNSVAFRTEHNHTFPTTPAIATTAATAATPSESPAQHAPGLARSMSLSFPWRHRSKSAAVLDDLTPHFHDLSSGSNSSGIGRRRPNWMSIDELRFTAARGPAANDNVHSAEPFGERHNGQWATAVTDDEGQETEDEAPALPHSMPNSSSAGKMAIKGIIRRASVSLHDFMHRRASFAGGRPPGGSTDESAAAGGFVSASHFLPNRLRSAHTYSQSHSPVPPRPHHPMRTRAPSSSAAESRPITSHAFHSWRRLRQVASFRHSRTFDSDVLMGSDAGFAPGHAVASPYDHSPHPLDQLPAHREMLFFPPHDVSPQTGHPLSSSAPLAGGFSSMNVPPGVVSGPPIIPLNTGGAARAAAAAAFQHDMLQMQQNKWLLHPDEYGNDHESGIGIAVTATGSDSANDDDDDGHLKCDSAADSDADIDSDAQLVISKVDFVAHLPVELSIMILAQLDAAGLAIASRVSRKWHTVVQNQHIWRESFMREKTGTYATSSPVRAGVGMGVPVVRPTCDWRQIYRVKQELDSRWKEGKTRPVYLNGHSDSIYCLQFDESKIITGSRDKTIRIWDMHTLACRLVIGPPDVVHDSKLLFGEDGQPAHYITTAYHTRSACSMPAAVSFPMHHSASILCLQYDDRILVTGSSDASCIVYSVKSGYRPVRRLRHHSAAVLDLCFDERHIVTCSKDISICVWDRETGAMLKQLRGHSGPVNAVQMRGNTIVSCSGDFRVKLWNIETGRAIREFTGHTKGLACSQFSEDGRFVASAGNDRVIRIWDANTGECVREMKAHENLVRSLHIDSVSGRLVSGSYDRDIKVFDMETGQQLLDFPQWHQSWVLSAKSDYRRIISTGQDPKVLVMDFGAGIDGIEMLETVNAATCNDICNGRISGECSEIQRGGSGDEAGAVTQARAGYI